MNKNCRTTGSVAAYPLKLQFLWAASGSILLGGLTVISLLSPQFIYGGDTFDRPIPLVVILLSLCGIVYMGTVSASRKMPNIRPLLGWIFAVGLSARLVFLFSTPICETDFYRYLWDGGVTVSGHNPFEHVPLDIIEDNGPRPIQKLANESGEVLPRVNHPGLATVYPTTCQAVFAAAHWIAPWNLTAWRLTLLAFDLATLLLLALLLRRLALPMAMLSIYWWNPLLIKESVNSVHMDVIILPFLLAALLFTLKGKYKSAAAALAFASGAKLWPIILLPLLLRPLANQPRRLVNALLIYTALLGTLLTPIAIAAAKLGNKSGFVAYSEHWAMNHALFRIFMKMSELIPTLFGAVPSAATNQMISRAMAATILLGVIIWRVRQSPRSPHDVTRSAMIIVAALFLLSPTQFPWYFTWFLPLLTLCPSYGLLFLTVTLPLYYLRFYFAARDNVGVFDHGIVWLEYLPVWMLVILEVLVKRTGLGVCPQSQIPEVDLSG